jgi:hypothetical protein
VTYRPVAQKIVAASSPAVNVGEPGDLHEGVIAFAEGQHNGQRADRGGKTVLMLSRKKFVYLKKPR